MSGESAGRREKRGRESGDELHKSIKGDVESKLEVGCELALWSPDSLLDRMRLTRFNNQYVSGERKRDRERESARERERQRVC